MKDTNETVNDTELRCPEAREVMERIPSGIIRWGMTVMALIAGAMLIAACIVRWPETAECPCSISPTEYGDFCRVTISLTPQVAVQLTAEGALDFTVASPLLPDELPFKGTVTVHDIYGFRDGVPEASVGITLPQDTELPVIGTHLLEARAIFIISERRLIYHLFPLLERFHESAT